MIENVEILGQVRRVVIEQFVKSLQNDVVQNDLSGHQRRGQEHEPANLIKGHGGGYRGRDHSHAYRCDLEIVDFVVVIRQPDPRFVEEHQNYLIYCAKKRHGGDTIFQFATHFGGRTDTTESDQYWKQETGATEVQQMTIAIGQSAATDSVEFVIAGSREKVKKLPKGQFLLSSKLKHYVVKNDENATKVLKYSVAVFYINFLHNVI